MKSIVKILSEIIPLIIFFYLHKNYNMQIASIGLVVTTILAVIAIYVTEGKLTKMQIISAVLVSVFGLLTAFTGDSTFIKIKPTIIYSSFAFAILICAYYKKYIIKHLFANAFNLPENIWNKISLTWGGFFIFLAILNEAIWRNYSEGFWVKFKVFGFIPITIIFILAQIPYLLKYNRK